MSDVSTLSAGIATVNCYSYFPEYLVDLHVAVENKSREAALAMK